MKITRKKEEEAKLDPWLDEKFLAHEPVTMPTGLSKVEIQQRLHGGLAFGGRVTEGIVGYNRTKIKESMFSKCTTEGQLKIALAKSGYDWKLAIGVGIPGSSEELLTQYMESTKKSAEFARTKSNHFDFNPMEDIPD